MNCIRFVLVALMMISCASNKIRREVNVPKGEPVWLYSSQEF
jgi:hypothetical protein